MIINIRGTNGSGKSFIARTLIEQEETFLKRVRLCTREGPMGPEGGILAYSLPRLKLTIIGPYDTDCGGCDAIKTQDEVCAAVMEAAGRTKHVLYEGVIVSTLYSRYRALAEKLRERDKGPVIWAYMDTPLDLCLTRIQNRNGGKLIKTELVADKVKAVESTRLKALAAGEFVMSLDHRSQTAIEQIREKLR